MAEKKANCYQADLNYGLDYILVWIIYWFGLYIGLGNADNRAS